MLSGQHHSMPGLIEKCAVFFQEVNDPGGALNANIMEMLTEWNKEAVDRCKILSPASLLPQHIRQVFHSSTFYHANLGCLLEQIAR